VVDDAGGDLAHEVWLQFGDGLGAGERPAFEHRFAQANEAFIGVDFQKERAGLNEKSL